MKKAVVVFIIFLAIFISPTPVKADDNLRVFLDGQELTFSVPPVIVDGRVMVPLREIAEYLSLPLQWDAATMTAAIYNNCCTVGCSEAWIRLEPVELDVPPMIINGRLLVPLRFMAEVARCSADYNPTERIVQLRSTGGSSSQLDNSVWIYYSQNFNIGVKYRQRPDGSQKAIIYSGDWADRLKLCDNNVYFMGVNSENKERIFKVADSGNPSALEIGDVLWDGMYIYRVDGNDCYVLANSGSNKTAIEKHNLTTGKTAVVVENPQGYEPFQIYNGWIYYTDKSDCRLYRVKTAGGSKSKIVDPSIINFTIEDDKIFYRNTSGILYKCNLNGTEPTVVCSDITNYFVVDHEWVYYTQSCEEGIWKIKTDGTNRTKLCDDGFMELTVKNGWVYYLNEKANRMLYAMKTDGTCKTKITAQTVENIIVK